LFWRVSSREAVSPSSETLQVPDSISLKSHRFVLAGHFFATPFHVHDLDS
jgi:hypothetical protein